MEYWSMGSEEVIKVLSSSKNGLTEEEVDQRLKEHGLNDIPKRMEKSTLSLLISQIKDPLIITLIIASVVSYFTGGMEEAIIIISIVFVNTLVGFVQEHKSEKALQKLCKYITYKAKLLRNGKLAKVDTRRIVPGDIVLLETGDRIPADLRLIETDELEIDESLVTGESFPVHKEPAVIRAEKLEPQKMKNIAFMGTLVMNGKGKGIVISTGMKSTFGKIVGYLKSEEPETNYQKNIKNFSKFLIKAMVVGIIFIFITNSLTGKKLFDSALFSLALAVGIIPETLPAIITVSLSTGAIRMSKNGVIIKKLAVIEDLGNMDILCTDKTGTLTENKITLVDYVDLDGKKDEELVKVSYFCALIENPIDVAICEYIREKGISEKREVIEVIPFDFTRKRMSVVIRDGERFLLVCKGAPESVISACTNMKTSEGISKINKTEVEKKFEEFFKKGYRVIAVATKTVEKKRDYNESDERGLTLLGFLCFIDPPKITAKPSIYSLKKLGVDIKILTGDHPLITTKIAKDTGIEVTGVITGREIDRMDDNVLCKVVEETNIFARLAPEHKVRIVSALKKNKHVVGFLGDGVNDAPALRYADVGVSVENSVDIAKEGADIILTRKSLRSILDGIVEGRKTFTNTTKYILNTVSANIGNVSTLAIVSTFLNFLPMLPSQILLTNLLSDGPLLSISMDRVDEEEMKTPQNWNIKFIRNFSVFFGGISSVFDFITMTFLWFLAGANVAMFRTGWFLESTLSEIFVTFAIRTRKKFYRSRPGKMLIVTSIIVALLTIFITYSPFNIFFGFVRTNLLFFLIIIAILSMYFSVVELIKHWFYKKFRF